MRIKNKEKILFGLKIFLVIAFVSVLLFSTIINYNQGLDFKSLYSDVGEILLQESVKTNTYKDKMILYVPKGYKFQSDSYIMIRNESYIEIIPEQIDANSESYSINPQKELIFQQGKDFEDSNIAMGVWFDNERYDVLIVEKDKYSITGNFAEETVRQGIIDMANILNSLKIKEIE